MYCSNLLRKIIHLKFSAPCCRPTNIFQAFEFSCTRVVLIIRKNQSCGYKWACWKLAIGRDVGLRNFKIVVCENTQGNWNFILWHTHQTPPSHSQNVPGAAQHTWRDGHDRCKKFRLESVYGWSTRFCLWWLLWYVGRGIERDATLSSRRRSSSSWR